MLAKPFATIKIPQPKQNMTRIIPYLSSHRAALLAYRLPAAQMVFTREPHEWLVEGFSAQLLPVTILHRDAPVGFFILDHGEDKFLYTANPHALLLRSMSVHPDYQGQGIGKQALLQLPAFVAIHCPEADEIVLGVNHANHSAHQLYVRSGFVDTGRTLHGSKGLQYILSLSLP